MSTVPCLLSALSLFALMTSPDIANAQGRRGGPRGPRGKTKIVERFDTNGNGRLETAERVKAKTWLKENPVRRGRGRRFGRGGLGDQPAENDDSSELPILPNHVKNYGKVKLYEQSVLRTVFLYFQEDDWYDELAAFYRTDVEIPATMVIDGKSYRDVGIRFRGNSSYFGVRGKKKSFNLSLDFVNKKQRLLGYKTINLLNAHSDPSFLREVVYSQICREYLPTVKANLVKLVINGENWGVYVNVQQLNRDFIKEWFGTKRGTRWKVPPDFSGGGALTYRGDTKQDYENSYELKSGNAESWQRLANLCKVLKETSDADLSKVLPKYLDIDNALWFLALDCVFLDGDGYHSRGSDYGLYEDKQGRFHPIPYDNNEILRQGRGRGGPRPSGIRSPRDVDNPQRGGARRAGGGGQRAGGGRRRGGPPGAGGPTLSPLALESQSNRPLASRLLAVPMWRARYLHHVRTIVDTWLDWKVLGPVFERHFKLIADEVKKDDKSLYGLDAFENSLNDLRTMVEARRKFLLGHKSLKGPWPGIEMITQREIVNSGGTRALVVTTAIARDAKVDKVLLWYNDASLGPYRSVSMFDDGKHGDLAANDGVFGATTAGFANGTKLRFYVEARSSADIGTTSFLPAKAEAAPKTHRLGRK